MNINKLKIGIDVICIKSFSEKYNFKKFEKNKMYKFEKDKIYKITEIFLKNDKLETYIKINDDWRFFYEKNSYTRKINKNDPFHSPFFSDYFIFKSQICPY